MMVSPGCEGRDEIGGPASAAQAQPFGCEPSRPCSGEHARDSGLIGLGGRRTEGERDFAKTELEQPVAASRLQ